MKKTQEISILLFPSFTKIFPQKRIIVAIKSRDSIQGIGIKRSKRFGKIMSDAVKVVTRLMVLIPKEVKKVSEGISV